MFSPKTNSEGLAPGHRARSFKGGYFRSENEAIDLIGPLLGASAIAVYHIMCRHAHGDVVRISVSQIVNSACSGCSRAKVFRVLDELVFIGAIERRSCSGQRNEYALCSLKGRTLSELGAKLKARQREPVSELDGAEDRNPSMADTGVVSRKVETRHCVRRDNKEGKTQDCKTELPPAPLLKEGGDLARVELLSNLSSTQGSAWRRILLELKSQFATAPLRSKNLRDEYDEYFRDTYELAVVEPNVIVIGADDPEKASEGLRKYNGCISKIAREEFGFDVEIAIARGAHSRATATSEASWSERSALQNMYRQPREQS